MLRSFTVALLLTPACGGKDKAAPVNAAPLSGSGEHAADDHHANLPPEVNAFHELLRPLWHADKGDPRKTDTCAAVPQLTSSANAIATSVPPQTANADAWTTATNALVAAIRELDAVCKAGDLAAFESAFSKVHDAFHALMKASREVNPNEPAPTGGGHQGSGGGTHDDHGGHHH
jgi:hypothetical protein